MEYGNTFVRECISEGNRDCCQAFFLRHAEAETLFFIFSQGSFWRARESAPSIPLPASKRQPPFRGRHSCSMSKDDDMFGMDEKEEKALEELLSARTDDDSRKAEVLA